MEKSRGKVSNSIFCYNAGLQNGKDYFYGKINQRA